MTGNESHETEDHGHKLKALFHHMWRMFNIVPQTFIKYTGPFRIGTSFTLPPPQFQAFLVMCEMNHMMKNSNYNQKCLSFWPVWEALAEDGTRCKRINTCFLWRFVLKHLLNMTLTWGFQSNMQLIGVYYDMLLSVINCESLTLCELHFVFF